MQSDARLRMLQDARARYLAGTITRRQVIGLLGALGLSVTAAPWLRRDTAAKNAPAGHAAHGPAAAIQEGTPPAGAEGPPPATPTLGEQPDGSTTWKVLAGGFNEELGAEYSIFLPETITINAGDRIYFEIGGFHNVVFGDVAPKPLFLPDPDPGTPVPASTGAPDAPQLMFNPEVLFPAGGDSIDGTTYVNSGVAIDPTAPPIVLTFPTAGTFDYICQIHAMHMKGQVIVQEAGAELPNDQAAYDQQVADRIAELDVEAQALVEMVPAATPAAGGAAVHEVYIGNGEEYIDTFRYYPYEVTIAAGDTVRWVWKGSMTPHTVTFLGGEEPVEDILFQGGEAGPPKVVLNPVSFYPSAKPATYSGDGLVNSGYLADFPGLNGTTFELTFDQEGEYKYYCILHAGSPDDPPTEGMVGKVTVQAAG